MKNSIRISIVCVAGSLVNKCTCSAVMDQSICQEFRMNASFANGNIDVSFLDDNSKLIGMTSGQDASYFHTGENATVSLKFNGTLFSGLDGLSGRNFNGSVQGKYVKLYDYDEGKHLDYLLIV